MVFFENILTTDVCSSMHIVQCNVRGTVAVEHAHKLNNNSTFSVEI